MRYVKLMQVHGEGCYECEHTRFAEGLSEWTELSEEDFKVLKSHIQIKNKGRYNDLYIIVEQFDEVKTTEFIDDLKKFVEEERNKIAQERMLAEQKKAAKLQKKLDYEAEQKRLQYEKLKAEFEPND